MTKSSDEYTIRPIGIIHTPHGAKQDTPIQGTVARDAVGTVEVFPGYEEALKDIEGFSRLILLYRFDRAGEVILCRPTFLDDEPHGVFASRHPCRPNGIGLTIVELAGRRGTVLDVRGVDMLDGTPLIDIKPYILRFDCFPDAVEGWITGKANRPKPEGRE